MGEYIDLKLLVNAMAFSLFGIFVFWVALWLWDKITPYKMWEEIIQKQNMAFAMVVSAVIIGLSIIIGIAHG